MTSRSQSRFRAEHYELWTEIIGNVIAAMLALPLAWVAALLWMRGEVLLGWAVAIPGLGMIATQVVRWFSIPWIMRRTPFDYYYQ